MKVESIFNPFPLIFIVFLKIIFLSHGSIKNILSTSHNVDSNTKIKPYRRTKMVISLSYGLEVCWFFYVLVSKFQYESMIPSKHHIKLICWSAYTSLFPRLILKSDGVFYYIYLSSACMRLPFDPVMDLSIESSWALHYLHVSSQNFNESDWFYN